MIEPIKAYYIISRDTTQICYYEIVRNKPIEKILEIKGRLKVKPTHYNIIKIIEENLKLKKDIKAKT